MSMQCHNSQGGTDNQSACSCSRSPTYAALTLLDRCTRPQQHQPPLPLPPGSRSRSREASLAASGPVRTIEPDDASGSYWSQLTLVCGRSEACSPSKCGAQNALFRLLGASRPARALPASGSPAEILADIGKKTSRVRLGLHLSLPHRLPQLLHRQVVTYPCGSGCSDCACRRRSPPSSTCSRAISASTRTRSPSGQPPSGEQMDPAHQCISPSHRHQQNSSVTRTSTPHVQLCTPK